MSNFYVSKHILRTRSGVFFIKSNGLVEPLFHSFRTYQPRLWWLSFEMIASQKKVASHQSRNHRVLFVTANRHN